MPVVIALLLLILGCSSAPEALVAESGRVQVSPASDGWTRVEDGNRHAVLEVRHQARDMTLRVFEVSRDGLPDTPAAAFERLRTSYGRSGGTRVTARSPATATTVGGLPGLRAEVCYRNSDGQAFTCELLQVEAPGHLYLLDLRTPSERWWDNEAETKAVLASFRLL